MPIAYVPSKSSRKFLIPKTLQDDFDRFLEHDIPGSVMSFTLLDSWYDQYEEHYKPLRIRGQIYPDSTKSRYSNTDNNLNFRASRNSPIKKGDMIIDPQNTIYLLDWQVPGQPNNKMSRAVRCNAKFTFMRYQKEVVDPRGYLIEEEGWKTIVDDLPCNAYRYDGRPEFSSVSGTPGVAPNALTIISIQFNEQTKNIQEEDQFTWGDDTYIVIDINRVGLNIDQTRGVLTLQCRKKAGGINVK